jgi:2-phosphosulfolactate phosphatase
MRIRIDLLPRGDYAGELVVLIDTLRTCTVAPILFDRGLESLALSASIREARHAATSGMLLIGERGGVPPEGFNHGNSPVALRDLDLTGRRAVLVSDNAPRALPALVDGDALLIGSLYNASALAEAVRSSGAERVSLVCSGYQGQEDLDDTVTAGFLAGEISRRSGGANLEGAAHLAIGLLRAFPDPLDALWHSAAGRELRRGEQAEDLAVASMISQSPHVPRLSSVQQGRLANLYHFALASS